MNTDQHPPYRRRAAAFLAVVLMAAWMASAGGAVLMLFRWHFGASGVLLLGGAWAFLVAGALRRGGDRLSAAGAGALLSAAAAVSVPLSMEAPAYAPEDFAVINACVAGMSAAAVGAAALACRMGWEMTLSVYGWLLARSLPAPPGGSDPARR